MKTKRFVETTEGSSVLLEATNVLGQSMRKHDSSIRLCVVLWRDREGYFVTHPFDDGEEVELLASATLEAAAAHGIEACVQLGGEEMRIDQGGGARDD